MNILAKLSRAYFRLDGQMYLQSNNVIQPVINKEVVLDFYKARGYNIISKI